MIKPGVYNIAPGQSFLDSLAKGIWNAAAGDPAALADMRILLPSRRAARNLRDAFLRLSDGKPVLLPRLSPLGDVDADEISLNFALQAQLEIPPAISRLRRQILLAHAVSRVPGMATSFDRAVALGAELGDFLDEVQNEGLDFSGLEDLVPVQSEYSRHWQVTLQFLKILTENWPGILAERGLIDYAQRRRLLIEAQGRLWAEKPPQGLVIAAGSTGSLPATAELLKTVAGLPRGVVVLPGLDPHLDAASWDEIAEDHPQYNLKRLIERFGIAREDILDWSVDETTPATLSRAKLASEMMRPCETTANWQKLKGKIDAQALEGLARIDCATQQEEADTIALILREALEKKGKTAALITPDRDLAQRVTSSLHRWGVEIDDSGGQPLSGSSAGTFLRLSARIAAENLAPVPLLACLKHALFNPGMDRAQFLQQVFRLEKLALRGPRPAPGFAGLKDRIVAEGADADLIALVENIERRAAPFFTLFEKTSAPFAQLLAAHTAFAESVSGAENLWAGDDGEAAANFINELLDISDDMPEISGAHYALLLEEMMRTPIVRTPIGLHPRLHILGQLEARLLNADLVVLGGLNEGTWPAEAQTGPWMSRPMRRDFGLPVPERAIGLAAHDFQLAFCAPRVIITRAGRVGGSPSRPARWLLRLETVLAGAGLSLPKHNAQDYRGWALSLDRPEKIKPCPRPAPCPPLELRPEKLSVTWVEKWMRDPYALFAGKILRLEKLDPVDADPGAADRGTILHKSLEEFMRRYPRDMPDNAVDELIAIGADVFEKNKIAPEVRAFWWPRFVKMAGAFVEEEKNWRKRAQNFAVESKGEVKLAVGGEDFTLTAKADRIDAFNDGTLAIIDYKTGQPPGKKDIALGFSPQLPLEALIAEDGNFEGIKSATVSYLAHWQVSGGRVPVDVKEVEEFDVDAAKRGVERLVARYREKDSSYPSRPRADHALRHSDFDHLARIREWALEGGGEEDE